MATREGYERLLDGQESGLATPAASFASAPSARGQSLATANSAKLTPGPGAVSLTASAAAPAQQPSAESAAQWAPATSHLDAAPDALGEWQACSNLLSLWLGVSVGTFILSLLTFHLGIFAAVCGILGSKQLSCSRGANIAAAVKATHILALMTIAFATFSAIVTFAFSAGLSRQCAHDYNDDEADLCGKLADTFFLCSLWYGLYTALAYQAAKRVGNVRRLLNPVSSGVVAV